MFADVRHLLETLPPVHPLTAPEPARTGFELRDGDDLDAVLAGLVASHTDAPLGVGELLRQRPPTATPRCDHRPLT